LHQRVEKRGEAVEKSSGTPKMNQAGRHYDPPAIEDSIPHQGYPSLSSLSEKGLRAAMAHKPPKGVCAKALRRNCEILIVPEYLLRFHPPDHKVRQKRRAPEVRLIQAGILSYHRQAEFST
jgi:hypothetical protein